MAIRSRNVLKAWFETTDVPTEQQFADWIDSFFHKSEDVTAVLAWVAAPSSSGAAGTAGQIAYDADYFYVCVATNSWKRVPISDW
jgi:hypothetical protein